MKNNLGNKEIMAKNIRRFLEIKHMTIKDLASAIDVPYNTVGDWTRADAYPRIDKIERMANLFGGRKALKNQRRTAFVHRCVKRVQKPFLSHKNKKIPGKKAGEG